MLKKPWLGLLLTGLLSAVFVWGLVRLFVLRYEQGDVYPPYSSLRADPLGAKILATALGELPGVEVRRNFRPLPKLRPRDPVTLVYAGVARHSYWTDDELLAFDDLVVRGSRAVFTFFPCEQPPSDSEERRADGSEQQKKKARAAEEKKGKKEKKTTDKKKDAEGEKPDQEDETSKTLLPFETVARRWGFAFDYLPGGKTRSFDRHAALVEPGGHLEPDISWHSALYFKDLKPQWKVLYMCDTRPVVIERTFGRGSIILAADSFFLSNEALRSERHSRLISQKPKQTNNQPRTTDAP